MPAISVVLPLYNKEDYIKDTIQSVLNQKFTDFELIIVNDGSTDNSLEKIKDITDPRLKIFNQTNQGVAVARNFGGAKSTGDLIAFIDADDLWHPNHLSEIIKLSQQFPEAAFFGTAYQIKYQNIYEDFVYRFKNKYVLLDKYYKYDKGQALFYTSNFAIKKAVFIKEQGFKPAIDAEDTEFFLRLGLQYPMAYSQTITMIHLNESENSLFSQYQLEKKIHLLDFFAKEELKDPDLKAYLDMLRFAWVMEYALGGNINKAATLKNQIDVKNLNTKQKILLKLPPAVLKLLKKAQRMLRQKGIHLSAFSKKV